MSERFLISRLSSLGDVVCSLPAASALKSGFSACHVTWVVDARFAGVVECCDAVDEVIATGIWRPELDQGFDAALDLQGLLKSALPVRAAKAGRKLGYHWQREGSWLFSQRVLPDKTSLHIVDQYVDVARAAGGEAHHAEFALRVDPDSSTRMNDLLRELGLSGKVVALNAGAGWASKRWPGTHFAELADLLRAESVSCLLIGAKGAADLEAAEEVSRHAKEPVPSALGRTSVKDLVALLDLCCAHVGGDTGSTHVMAALGRPAIGLYSITNPTRSCPYGQIDRCHYEPSGLDAISPRAVFRSVMEALS